MTFVRDAWAAYVKREGLLLEHARRGGLVKPKANKYHAVRTQVDGHWFASKKEALRYQSLKLLQVLQRIDELELQPKFPLTVQGRLVGTFRADFRYLDLTTGEIVVEDVKSPATKTEAYTLRKRLAETIHCMTVEEV